MPIAYVVYSGSEFLPSALAASSHLEARGFQVFRQDVGDRIHPDQLLAPLGPADLSVWFSHGGWDGPMTFLLDEPPVVDFGELWGPDPPEFEYEHKQIDPIETPTDWQTLRQAMRRHLKPGGMLAVHACHSSGSNRYEDTSGTKAERWVQQVARDMRLYATGVEGSTASANAGWAIEFLRFVLDGTRNRQPTRVYAPGGTWRTQWPGWLRLDAA